MKVTGQTARNCVLGNIYLGEENSKRVHITYIDQNIMNLFDFPVFDNKLDDMDDINKVQQSLL